MKALRNVLMSFVLIAALLVSTVVVANASEPIKVLFYGAAQGHNPQDRLRDIAPAMIDRGIHLVYVHNDLSFLNLETLNQYDVLMVFGNQDSMPEPQYADAIVEYVENGGGVVAIHSASFMWRNTPWIELIGGQFQSHPAIQEMSNVVVNPDHPIMAGWEPFTSADEPYVHTRHNTQNRTVLALSTVHEDEPYTWIRTQGEGRVFYTAWGHDQRTWTNTGFHDLIERGILWAAGFDVQERLASREISNPYVLAEHEVPLPVYGGGDPIYEFPLPLDAEESMKRMVTPAGFSVDLFADDSMVSKVIDFNWDEQGRLWVLESVDYPYHFATPSGATIPETIGGNDRLVILEDTTGDGIADKRTVFVDQLNVPTSFTFWDGGVIIQMAPYTIYVKDTDGDDKADHREVMLIGWSRNDTHAGASNLTYGLDNLIWLTGGYSAGANPFNQSLMRFNPEDANQQHFSQVMQLVGNTPCNTWGLGFTEEGLIFGSTATCGAPSGHVAIPAWYYDKVDWLNVPGGNVFGISGNVYSLHFDPYHRQVEGQNWHRFTASPGHSIYTARAFPEQYWNRVAFVSEPTGSVTGAFVLEPNGAGFTSHHPMALLASDDPWTAPVVAKVGPDGAVWISDWYNIVIQHNPTPTHHGFTQAIAGAYVTPNRENDYGRIYRIVWDDAPEYEPLNLAEATGLELVQALTNDNKLWRDHAQRLLVQGDYADDAEVVDALIALVKDKSVDAIGLNPGAIHALWTLHGMGHLDGSNRAALEAAYSALKHPSAGVRRNAGLVLPPSQESVVAIVMSGILNDDNLQTRLAAFLALSDQPASVLAGEAIFEALDLYEENRTDRWLREAGIIAATVHSEGFIAAGLKAGLGDREIDMTNLISNGDFSELVETEDGLIPAGWNTQAWSGAPEFSVVQGGGPEGMNAVRIHADDFVQAAFTHSVRLQGNNEYVMVAWVKAEEATPGYGAHLEVGTEVASVTDTADWQQIEVRFTTPSNGNAELRLALGGTNHWWSPFGAGTAWFADVQVYDVGPPPIETIGGIFEMIARD